MASALDADTAARIKAVFRDADTAGDGVLSRQEFEAAFCLLADWSEDEFDRIFKALDSNGDGKLSYDEFIEWVMSGPKAMRLCEAIEAAGQSLPIRLEAIRTSNPYIEHPQHALHDQWKVAHAAVDADRPYAKDVLGRLASELHRERETLRAAFNRFDFTGTGSLSREEMKHIAGYLCFPDADEDIDKLMRVADASSAGVVSFADFQKYVGVAGGSMKLFAQRRLRISEEAGFTNENPFHVDPEEERMALKEAGVDEDAVAYWRLVVSQSEFAQVAKLGAAQKNSIALIRRLARKNHDDALPLLQARVEGLGFKDMHLWMTLAYIRELCPIVIHLDLDNILTHMESDTHYRNQFETGTGGGTKNIETRSQWEHALFGGCYDTSEPVDRTKYGVLNVMNDHRGVMNCNRYGDSFVVMKDVRLRTTFAPCDSSGCDAEKLAVLDYYAHVLHEFDDRELAETIKVANAKDASFVGDSCSLDFCNYKEAQYHGEVRFDSHIERLVAHERHRTEEDATRIEEVAKKWGWSFSWMDEEHDRICEQVQHKVSKSWHDRLAVLQDLQDEEAAGCGLATALKVSQGFCKVGCGRRVAQGESRSGVPYTTCCKGCVLGFGHDRKCGKHKTEQGGGESFCKSGCSFRVAFGRDGKGKTFTTCCRGCASGKGHDSTCPGAKSAGLADGGQGLGLAADAQSKSKSHAAGRCKFGCGRSPARGTAGDGMAFDTCCRMCAKGAGHTDGCNKRFRL